MKVVFETPTILDLQALTVLGLSAKQSNNPIGYFGTGLKYAMAILAREGFPVHIHIGTDTFRLAAVEKGFRGEIYKGIELLSDTEIIPLPYTTELGKNWELWQAFRELYCNTVDEGGTTYLEEGETQPREGTTLITVESEKMVDIFNNRFDRVFLEGADTLSKHVVQVIPRESNYIYYRGIRVMETEKPCLNTYNILSEITLTEDRTAKYPYCIEIDIRNHLLKEDNEEVLEAALNAGEEYWESGLAFSIHIDTSDDVSEEFRKVGTVSSNQPVKTALYKTSNAYKVKQEQEREAKKAEHFCTTLIEHLEAERMEMFEEVVLDNREELIEILEEHLERAL